MKAMFGVVSLLVALCIVGLLAVRQLKAVSHAGAGAASAAPTSDGTPAVPAMSGSGTLREQSVQLQNKVAADAIKAMNDGAAARSEAADK
jgi:hypothetical protein